MTIADRNRILAACLTAEAVFAVVFAVSAIFSLSLPPDRFAKIVASPEFRWEPSFIKSVPAYLRSIAICGTLGLFSLATGFWILRAFRKTPSYEILFFAVFVCSLGLEAFRVLSIWSIGLNAPISTGPLLTRIVFAGRWAGTFALFASSLYAVGLEYEKADWALAIILFLSMILASLMPLNSGKLTQGFTSDPGYIGMLTFALAAASLLSLANFYFAAFLRGSRDYVWMGTGVLLAMIGRCVFFFFTDLAISAAGLIILIAGALMFTRRCFRRALWQ